MGLLLPHSGPIGVPREERAITRVGPVCGPLTVHARHPTTEKVYESLKEKYPTISLATVYKTLHIFKEVGLIQELNFSDGNIRYDPNMELHINIICIKCGGITDYSNKKIKDLWQFIISDLNFKPEGQRIDIYYECENCKNIKK